MVTAAPLTEPDRHRLLSAARDVAARAYAPYSGLRVGAAALTETGGLYVGGNVENASYGLSLCAERAALAAAVAAEGPALRLRALAVACIPPGPCPPCGACRQVILEFGPDAWVLFPGPDGPAELPASALLPQGFVFRRPSGP